MSNMLYTMFQYDTKKEEEEIHAIVQRYITKHGKPPQIIEVNPSVKNIKIDGVPVLSFQLVQKGLVYLGEEQKGDEK